MPGAETWITYCACSFQKQRRIEGNLLWTWNVLLEAERPPSCRRPDSALPGRHFRLSPLLRYQTQGVQKPITGQRRAVTSLQVLWKGMVMDPGEELTDMGRISFEDVAVHFSDDEWQTLECWQKDLHQDVMRDNYEAVSSLGLPAYSSDMVNDSDILQICVKEEPASEDEDFFSPEMNCDEFEVKTVRIKEECSSPSSPPPSPPPAILPNESEKVRKVLKKRRLNKDRPPHLINRLLLHKGQSEKKFLLKKSSSMKLEQREYDEVDVFPCDVCDRVFHSRSSLGIHARVHVTERPFVCQDCGKSFSRADHLKCHRRLHTDDNPYKCPECDRSFPDKFVLREHRQVQHNQLDRRLKEVKLLLQQDPSLSLSLLSGKRDFVCDVCQKSFTKSYNLKVHQRIHSGEKPFQCPKCDMSFSQNIRLKIHRTIHEEWAHEASRFKRSKPAAPPARTHKCNICEKSFSKSYTLKVHLRVHSGEKPYECDYCHKTFSKNNLLTVHKRIHSGERPYQCPDCPKNFSAISHLRVHKRTHSGERPYECSDCSKTFSDYSSMVRHQRVHSGAKPFICNICDKSFREKSHLTVHERTHTGERPYKCEECGRRFGDCSSYVEHQRCHKGSRPYKCEVCEKTFTKAYTLKVHLRAHSGERPYKCNQCPRSFSINYQLKTHKKRHDARGRLATPTSLPNTILVE